ncbi:MAG: DUF1828 domain-containing protein [Pseudomonadota bacterium]
MIDENVAELIGMSCEVLDEYGHIGMVNTPFTFEDGDPLPVYVEKLGNQIRFFDAGSTIIHLLGRGLVLDSRRKTRFIKNLAEPNGVALTDAGELEVWTSAVNAPEAFARYMAAMLALVRWEQEQIGVASDISILIDEVALCLRAIRPAAALLEAPAYMGISGAVYKVDFSLDGEAVLATNPHPHSVSSAAKKILDIRAATENAGLEVIVVIDDRHDALAAKREGLILGSVAKIWMMSRLEREAGISVLGH